MKKSLSSIMIVLVMVVSSTACNGEPVKEKKTPPSTQANQSGYSGKVIETMNTGGYTYIHVDTGKEKIWAAAPEFKVKVGDRVQVPNGAPMRNFESKTLNRTFDVVYFVGGVSVAGAGPSGQAPSKKKSVKQGRQAVVLAADVDFSGLKKPEGGKTIAEIYAQKKELSGKKVLVCGKVVKFNTNIMGKNWIHLQDGTGQQGSNDLTVTSADMVKAGDTVVASGIIALDRDLGHGYHFDILMENAKISKE